LKATILDLRYRMKDVLRALDRKEEVSILYHGKLKGVITPGKTSSEKRVSEHPFFNMRKGKGAVEREMEQLRGGRHRDL